MTAHAHDPAAVSGATPESAPDGGASTSPTRPRWLLPGLTIALVAGALVAAGVVPLSTVLYAGLFGGMIFMHVGGHGHGGHGGGGHGGHAAHSGGTNDTDDLSPGSSGSQPTDPGSAVGLDARAGHDSTDSETERHDQHSSHGCH